MRRIALHFQQKRQIVGIFLLLVLLQKLKQSQVTITIIEILSVALGAFTLGLVWINAHLVSQLSAFGRPSDSTPTHLGIHSACYSSTRCFHPWHEHLTMQPLLTNSPLNIARLLFPLCFQPVWWRAPALGLPGLKCFKRVLILFIFFTFPSAKKEACFIEHVKRF